jgi:hypothetical protein
MVKITIEVLVMEDENYVTESGSPNEYSDSDECYGGDPSYGGDSGNASEYSDTEEIYDSGSDDSSDSDFDPSMATNSLVSGAEDFVRSGIDAVHGVAHMGADMAGIVGHSAAAGWDALWGDMKDANAQNDAANQDAADANRQWDRVKDDLGVE